MKKYAIGVVAALLCLSTYAQKPINLVEKEIAFSHGTYPGFSLTIPEVRYNDVSKEWTKILQKGTKSKIQIENGELTIFGAQIDEVYGEPINLYSLLSSVDSTTILEVTFELKPKEYLNRAAHPSEYAKAKSMLFGLAKNLYSEEAKNQFKEEEKTLKGLERDLESLYNEKTRLEKSIVNDNSDIQEYTDKIVLLKQDASNLNDQLGKEKNLLTELEGEEARVAKQKEIDEIEKNKEKALKEAESLEKKILLRKSDIERSKLDIQTNTQEQARKMSEIEKQKEVTMAAEQKYNTILGYE